MITMSPSSVAFLFCSQSKEMWRRRWGQLLAVSTPLELSIMGSSIRQRSGKASVITEQKKQSAPQVFLKELRLSVAQSLNKPFAASDHQNNFSELIKYTYDEIMQREQQLEIEAFIAKRRAHYDQRLNEETEEFRRERKEIHDNIIQLETEKYKSDLANEMREYVSSRRKECESRLKVDVMKYHSVLKSYRDRIATGDEGSSGSGRTAFGNLSRNLSMDVANVVKLEQEEDITNAVEESDIDITNNEIADYVKPRLTFYETVLETDIEQHAQCRKAFYQELLQARTLRQVAKIRVDVENFRAGRQLYYEERLGNDALWIAKAFRSHYELCFLQHYARQACLLCQRQGKMNVLPTISISELNSILPLSNVLDWYARITLEDVTRDVFLKAARRVAEDHAGDIK